jgi:enamine deaminase RidA (YjgF/YER057c/UK114 family)
LSQQPFEIETRGSHAERPVSDVLRVGELVFVGARSDPAANTEEGARSDIRNQTQSSLNSIVAALEGAGAAIEDVVDVVSFHADVTEIGEVLDVAHRTFGTAFPAWTPVASTEVGGPGVRVAIKAIARTGAEDREFITPDSIRWWRRRPASAGCRKGDLLFVAGQYGSDADGNVNTPGDHGGQARNALNRVKEICSIAGGTLDDVIELTSFHQDPRGIEPSSTICEGEFLSLGKGNPVWTAAGTPGLLGFGMLGQYRAIADLTDGGRMRVMVGAGVQGSSLDAGAARKRRGTLIAVAGRAGTDAEGKVVARGDPHGQGRASFERMREGLEAVGASLEDLVEIVCLYKDRRSRHAVLDVADDYLDSNPGPAWTAAGMTGFGHEDDLHVLHGLAVV